MMLSARTESMDTLSASVESIILSAPPAEADACSLPNLFPFFFIIAENRPKAVILLD